MNGDSASFASSDFDNVAVVFCCCCYLMLLLVVVSFRILKIVCVYVVGGVVVDYDVVFDYVDVFV